MNKEEIIKDAKEKFKKCKTITEFKKKNGYLYRKCIKFEILKDITCDYNSLESKYKIISEKYTIDDILDLAKTMTKSKFMQSHRQLYNILIKIYKYDGKIIFRKRKIVPPKYSEEYIIGIIQNLKTIIEFESLYNKEYKYLLHKGELKKFCGHLIPKPYYVSEPQLITKYILDSITNYNGELNNRKLIHPYEIDVWYDKYNLAIEYDGMKWHKNNKNDIKKEEILKNLNINFIRITEKTKERNYEKIIKSCLIENIKLLEKIGLNIREDEIEKIEVDYIKIINFTIEKYKNIASKYDNKTDFINKDSKYYYNAKKLKILDVITSHFKNRFTDDDAIENLKNYRNEYDLHRKNKHLYKYCISKNIQFPYKPINRVKNFTDDKILKEYTSVMDLKIKNPTLHRFIRENKKYLFSQMFYYDELFLLKKLKENKTLSNFKQKNKRIYNTSIKNKDYDRIIEYYKKINYNKYFSLNLNLEEIKEICLRYKTIKEFTKDYKLIYNYLLKNNLIDQFFKHTGTLKMRNSKCKFLKEKEIKS